MADHQVVGKIGRVSAAINPGRIGEVMITVRGGSEAYLARSDDGNAIAAGTRVVVLEHLPPRTVIVSAVP